MDAVTIDCSKVTYRKIVNRPLMYDLFIGNRVNFLIDVTPLLRLHHDLEHLNLRSD